MYIHISSSEDMEVSQQPNGVYKVNGYSIAVNPDDKKIIITFEPGNSSSYIDGKIEMEQEEAMNLVSKIITILHMLSKEEKV